MLLKTVRNVHFSHRSKAATTALVLAGLAFSSTAALDVQTFRGAADKDGSKPVAASYVTPARRELAAIDKLSPTPAPDDAVPAPAEPSRSHWDDLADCESGRWARGGTPIEGSATWSSTAGYFEGGLQFAPPTWDGFRDADMPSSAHDASREIQILVAERVQAAQGWGAWPVCSRKVGLR